MFLPDVGGGSVPNDTRHSLARIPLRWMIRECFRTNSGIQFEADKLRAIAGIDPASLYPIVLPRPPPLEIHKEVAASLALINYAKSGKVSDKEMKMLADSAKLLEEKIVESQEKNQVKRTSSMQKTPSRPASVSGTEKRDDDLDSTASAPASIYGEDGDQDKSVKPHPFVSEEEEELFDALSPIYDQLKLAKPWWVLELLPIKQKMQRENGTWRKSYE